jgi:hypothetical protein
MERPAVGLLIGLPSLSPNENLKRKEYQSDQRPIGQANDSKITGRWKDLNSL